MLSLELSRKVLGIGSLTALAWLLAVGCSGRPEFVSGVCESVLAGKCGGPCETASDCESGLHCSAAKICTAECTAATAPRTCGVGNSCSADGRCTSNPGLNFGGAGGASNSSSGGSTNGECIDVKVDFTPQIPTVMLLIDQSGSMDSGDGFGAKVNTAIAGGTYIPWGCPSNNGDPLDSPNQSRGNWKWNVVRNVLFNPNEGVVKPLEKRVRFGMALYTSDNGWIDPNTNMKDPNMECPLLDEVPIKLANYQSMLDTMVCDDIKGDTPTGESLSAVASQLDEVTEPGDKVIVLATDGAPDSCDCPNFGNNDPVQCRDSGKVAPDRPSDLVKADVIARAVAIHAKGTTIHVIGVTGDSALMGHLQNVADAGGGKLYDGFDPKAIKDAFAEIINGARSCKIDLDGSITPGKESTGRISLDGALLVYGDTNGWKRNTPSQIELVGKACSTIKSGDHDLAISFPCGTFEPPITK